MMWPLLQGQHLEDTPLILVGTMWPGLLEWARRALCAVDPPLAHPEDLTIPHCAAHADAAIALIREASRQVAQRAQALNLLTAGCPVSTTPGGKGAAVFGSTETRYRYFRGRGGCGRSPPVARPRVK